MIRRFSRRVIFALTVLTNHRKYDMIIARIIHSFFGEGSGMKSVSKKVIAIASIAIVSILAVVISVTAAV